MGKRKKGEGRGLDAFEVALMKSMNNRGLPRDYIMSFIYRPGRKISPAAVDDVKTGKIGADIEPASSEETDLFIRKRMEEARPISERNFGGPTSQLRVNEMLRVTTRPQAEMGALEERFVEFKEIISNSKEAKAKIARTMAAYANASGGYLLFGIRDDRSVVGINNLDSFSGFCDEISDVVTNCFCPEIVWDKNVVTAGISNVGVIYVYASEKKPVIAMADYTAEIKKSVIFYRYEGKSQRIEPGDLLQILSDIRGKPQVFN